MAQVPVNDDARCVVDGVEYHAMSHPTCDGCAGDDDDICLYLPMCDDRHRLDKTSVIWVVVE